MKRNLYSNSIIENSELFDKGFDLLLNFYTKLKENQQMICKENKLHSNVSITLLHFNIYLYKVMK